MGTKLTLLSDHRDIKSGLAHENVDRHLRTDCYEQGVYIMLAAKYNTQEDIGVFVLSKQDALQMAKSIVAYYSQD